MKDKKKLIIGLAFLIVIFGVVVGLSFSFAVPLENDVRVKENSDLTYYIDVIYDGTDSNIVTSSDTAVANVYSDYIEVTDKIPEGLTFLEFINSEDGSIGATKRSDNTSCPGYVVDGIDGLKYDGESRTVSFRIKNLQAGCKITVGIKTKTPTLEEQKRIDFYNTAYGREGNFSVQSNTVHAFLGKEEETLYEVVYQYSGDVPEDAPALPPTASHSSGTIVGVSKNAYLEGYTFSGWKSIDIQVENETFQMPAKKVTFTGSFTKNKTYEVSYKISGEFPDGFMVPKDKNYSEGVSVSLDSLKPGDVVQGYRFLGWETEDVELPSTEEDESTIFTMPDHSVTFVGRFERISYQVSYQFQGSVIPPNADSLLPAVQTYYPGEVVTIAKFPETLGYKFLGWYQTDTFEMPEEDVVIYGEWMIEEGVFSPTITKEITNPKVSYQNGEVVEFKIVVHNPSDLILKDIVLEEQTEGCHFVDGEGYTVLNNRYVKILTLEPNQSISVFAKYDVGKDVVKNVKNTVELTGALSEDSRYHLDTSKKYKASVDFKVANISLNINKIDEDGNALQGAEFTLSSNTFYDIIAQKAVLDNEKSEFVSNSMGIDFAKAPSNTNGKGVYTRAGTEHDKYPVHYYRGIIDNNHVKFAGFCWKAVRTTETGGVKLIYDGVPDSNGVCNNTGTDSQIGTSAFNSSYQSPADVGYMTGTRYTHSNKGMGETFWYSFVGKTRTTKSGMGSTNYYYGDSVIYENGAYTLTNASQSAWSDTYSSLKGKYTCLSETEITCSEVDYVDSTNSSTMYYVKMTNGETYESLVEQAKQPTWVYGNDVTWNGTNYTLIDTVESKPMDWATDRTSKVQAGHRYTCLSASNTCSTVYYTHYTGNATYIYYMTLKEGKNINDAFDEMFPEDNNLRNQNNSTIKTKIDTWYQENMTDYTKYLEDTVWCNDRSIYQKNNWDKDNNGTGSLLFGAVANNVSTKKPTIACPNTNDSFTVSSEIGNGKLTYPVALLTADELTMAGNGYSGYSEDAYLSTGWYWWSLSPFDFLTNYYARVFYINSSGNLTSVGGTFGVRPSVSLAPGIIVSDGDGSSSKPYIVELNTDVSSVGLNFTGLQPNTTYTLRETKAPAGYQYLGDTLTVRVDGDGVITIPGYEVSSQDGVNRVSIVNKKINVLPNTGGVGVIPYIAVGLVFVISGVGCCIYLIRKRGEKYEKNHK